MTCDVTKSNFCNGGCSVGDGREAFVIMSTNNFCSLVSKSCAAGGEADNGNDNGGMFVVVVESATDSTTDFGVDNNIDTLFTSDDITDGNELVAHTIRQM